MPILVQEPSIYPEELFGDLESLRTEGQESRPERSWWVIYTKARQEKAISRELFARETPFYLPLVKRTNVCRGRKFSSYCPLFPGYVFLYASPEERVSSMVTNRVSRILEVSEGDQLRRDLLQIWQLIAANVPLTVESRLTTGDQVRIRRGPLDGLEGTVLVRRGQTRLLVSVNFLQQGASIEVDDFLLEPINL
jgi:transcriptional antiterminator RfaH